MAPRLAPLAALFALALAGCAKEVDFPAATALEYLDPPAGAWRLVRSPASTPTRIVLEVVGPADLATRGVGFNLRAPEAVRYGTFANGWPIEDTGVYELTNSAPWEPDPQEPVLLAGGVKPGHVLTVGVFQKDRRRTAKPSGVALARIALELDPAAGAKRGEALPLEILKAKYSPEDIGTFSPEPTQEMADKGHGVLFELAVGQLTAR